MKKRNEFCDDVVSVVVPVYNCELYLEQCVMSILGQTHNALEVILVDDGSTDMSTEICERFARAYTNIKLLRTDNRGAAAARRIGIVQSTGKYIMFVDSDDWIETDYVEKMLLLALSENVDVVVGRMKRFSSGKYYEDKQYFGVGYYDKNRLNKIVYREMLSADPFYSFGVAPSMCGKVFKRDIAYQNLDALNTGITMGEDGLFTYSALLDCSSLYITEIDGYVYRQNLESVTHCFNPRLLDEGERAKDYYIRLSMRKHWEAGAQIDEYLAFLCNSVVCKALMSSYVNEKNAKHHLILYIDKVFPKDFVKSEKVKLCSWKRRLNFYLLKQRRLFLLFALLNINALWKK